MLGKFKDYAQLVAAYTRINVKAQMEYRWGFFSEVLAMLINDGCWVIFWMVFFSRFPVLHGWTLQDVLTLWAVVTAGFGIAHGVMGNGLYLAGLIAEGQLDMWMLYPRAVLPHLLLGRSIATAWGDAAFGFLVYAAFVRPDATHLALFTLLSLSAAAVFIGFDVLSASLAFYIGNSTTLSEQWRVAMVMFSTYPQNLFDGLVRVILYTAIPAAFVGNLPVQALRSLAVWDAAIALSGAVAFPAVAAFVFYRGLRRYESGNLIVMRG